MSCNMFVWTATVQAGSILGTLCLSREATLIAEADFHTSLWHCLLHATAHNTPPCCSWSHTDDTPQSEATHPNHNLHRQIKFAAAQSMSLLILTLMMVLVAPQLTHYYNCCHNPAPHKHTPICPRKGTDNPHSTPIRAPPLQGSSSSSQPGSACCEHCPPRHQSITDCNMLLHAAYPLCYISMCVVYNCPRGLLLPDNTNTNAAAAAAAVTPANPCCLSTICTATHWHWVAATQQLNTSHHSTSRDVGCHCNTPLNKPWQALAASSCLCFDCVSVSEACSNRASNKRHQGHSWCTQAGAAHGALHGCQAGRPASHRPRMKGIQTAVAWQHRRAQGQQASIRAAHTPARRQHHHHHAAQHKMVCWPLLCLAPLNKTDVCDTTPASVGLLQALAGRVSHRLTWHTAATTKQPPRCSLLSAAKAVNMIHGIEGHVHTASSMHHHASMKLLFLLWPSRQCHCCLSHSGCWYAWRRQHTAETAGSKAGCVLVQQAASRHPTHTGATKQLQYAQPCIFSACNTT